VKPRGQKTTSPPAPPPTAHLVTAHKTAKADDPGAAIDDIHLRPRLAARSAPESFGSSFCVSWRARSMHRPKRFAIASNSKPTPEMSMTRPDRISRSSGCHPFQRSWRQHKFRSSLTAHAEQATTRMTRIAYQNARYFSTCISRLKPITTTSSRKCRLNG
jgi:hypothetical protein